MYIYIYIYMYMYMYIYMRMFGSGVGWGKLSAKFGTYNKLGVEASLQGEPVRIVRKGQDS